MESGRQKYYTKAFFSTTPKAVPASRAQDVQNRTPGALRIFWCYGPKQGEITIFAITPHP